MRKYGTWYGIFLKEQLKKWSIYVELAVLVAVILFGANCNIVTKPITKVGYCYAPEKPENYEKVEDIFSKDGVITNEKKNPVLSKDWLGAELNTSKVLSYVQYPDEMQLKAALMLGEIDSGFCLPDHFDADSSITCLTSPYSSKDALARQHVYTVWYRYLSEDVILEADPEFYGEKNEKREKLLLQANEEILKSEQVFHMEYIEWEGPSLTQKQSVDEAFRLKTTAVSGKQKAVMTIFPMQGMAGVLFMLFTFLTYEKRFQSGFRGIYQLLLGAEKRRFMAVYELASMTPVFIIMLFAILLTGKSRGFVLETVGLLLLFFWTLLLLIFIGQWIKKEENFRVVMILFLLLQVLVCPVFADVTVKVPLIRYIRMVTPLGFYLRLR